MFIDQVNIEVVAGNGGKGMVAFRREKYVPKGGPSGGNGGKGGSIIFRGSLNKTTLLDLKYNKIIKADSGENGKAKNMFGKDALDVCPVCNHKQSFMEVKADNYEYNCGQSGYHYEFEFHLISKISKRLLT